MDMNARIAAIKDESKDDGFPVTVVFRRYADGSILALFPFIPFTANGECTSYQRIGQHGAANYMHCIHDTTEPDGEIQDSEALCELSDELEKAGYQLSPMSHEEVCCEVGRMEFKKDCDLPRVLIQITGGVAEWLSDDSVHVEVCDYDNEPNKEVPASHQSLLKGKCQAAEGCDADAIDNCNNCGLLVCRSCMKPLAEDPRGGCTSCC